MRPYGRMTYTTYGETGIVTAHNADGTFQMTLDDFQPYRREMWGAKSRLNENAGLVHKSLTSSEVDPLVTVYRENAQRLRRLAKSFSDAATAIEDDHRGTS